MKKLLFICALVALASCSKKSSAPDPNASDIISTICGADSAGYSGNGIAKASKLAQPADITVDAAGNLYIADRLNCRIRKIDVTGYITTVAGSGNAQYDYDGISATSAGICFPTGVAVDAAGNIYIADQGNNRIRKVSANGTISTIAGAGGAGAYGGDGDLAIGALLNHPVRITIDAAGNIYIADQWNSIVRKINPAGIITRIAGTVRTPDYGGDGGPATAAFLNFPDGLAVDASGNLYIADNGNDRIRKVTPQGIISTVAGNGVDTFSGDGGVAISAGLASPTGVTVDADGNLYIADANNNCIRKVSASGIINTVAGIGKKGYGYGGYSGDGHAAIKARLWSPDAVAVDAAGNLYIADENNNRIRKVNK